MKICYLSENPLHLRTIMDYFKAKGHDVSYITFHDHEWKNVKNYYLKELIPRCYFTYFFNLSHVRNLLKTIKPDIIHAYYLTNFGFLGASSHFKPFVVSAVGSDALLLPYKSKTKSSISTFLINRIVRYVVKEADAVISMATHMNNKLLDLGTKPDKIHLLSEGVDLVKFNIDPNIKRDKEKIRVISSRNLEPVYNIELLIDAIPLVLKEIKDIEFTLIGDGSSRKKLEERVRSSGISDYVTFKGFLDKNEIPKNLNSSDIYVSTSFSDGRSVSLLEAMACGAFPVISDIPANRDIIKDGENGYLFPIDSKDILAEKIISAAKNKDLRTNQSIKNFEFIKNNYEIDFVMSKLYGIYEELVNRYKTI
jgi:L-malate glycosyltransferase